MKTPIYQVDAFSDRLFCGNPAAVCPLESWPDDSLLQRIAAENNLSETAFFSSVSDDLFRLRWFTPLAEVDLCGHATLATAFVIFTELEPDRETVRFESRGGALTVRKDGRRLTMNFPITKAEQIDPPEALIRGLGVQPAAVFAGAYYMAILEDEAAVRNCRPDLAALMETELIGAIVTAPGERHDFVSRFFGPKVGVPEDPVTGSAHCMTAPYWAKRLAKEELRAFQCSARGGEVWCEVQGDRVLLTGNAVLYMKGEIEIPD